MANHSAVKISDWDKFERKWWLSDIDTHHINNCEVFLGIKWRSYHNFKSLFTLILLFRALQCALTSKAAADDGSVLIAVGFIIAASKCTDERLLNVIITPLSHNYYQLQALVCCNASQTARLLTDVMRVDILQVVASLDSDPKTQYELLQALLDER